MSELQIKGQRAKEASYELMNMSTTEKNSALLAMASKLLEKKHILLRKIKRIYKMQLIKGHLK